MRALTHRSISPPARTMTGAESAKVHTHSAATAYFLLLSPNGSALWRAHRLKSQHHRHQTGELHYMRVRHADDTQTEGFK